MSLRELWVKNTTLVVNRWIQPKRISCSECKHPPTHLDSWEILKIRHQIQASPPVVSRHIRNTCGAWQVKDSCIEFRGCWQEVLQKEHRGVRNVLVSFFSTIVGGNEFAKFFPFSLSWPPLFPQSLRALDSSISSPSPLTDCLNIYTGGSVCPEPFLKQLRPASSPLDLVHEEFRPKWILASSGSSCQELHSFHLAGVKHRFLPSPRAPSATPGLHFVLLTLGGHSPLLSFSVALAVPYEFLFLLVVLQISMC